MKQYREIFANLLDELNRNPFIEVKKGFVGDAVSEDSYSYKLILKHYNIQLPASIMQFYHAISGCQIEWECDLTSHAGIVKYHPDDSLVSGQIVIRPLEEMLSFDTRLEADWWMSNLQEEDKQNLYNFRYLDFNDDYIRVGFIKEGSTIKDSPLYFITQESEGFNLANLSFDEYIEKWPVYKGYQGWQYNYFFNTADNSRRMEHYLKQLF